MKDFLAVIQKSEILEIVLEQVPRGDGVEQGQPVIIEMQKLTIIGSADKSIKPGFTYIFGVRQIVEVMDEIQGKTKVKKIIYLSST